MLPPSRTLLSEPVSSSWVRSPVDTLSDMVVSLLRRDGELEHVDGVRRAHFDGDAGQVQVASGNGDGTVHARRRGGIVERIERIAHQAKPSGGALGDAGELPGIGGRLRDRAAGRRSER